jgi:imidazolonepropionase-like amidohydrolase
LDALRAGTRDVARFLGERGGTLEPGNPADLVVLDGNPLADIRNTRRIHTVLTKGRVIGPDDRTRMLAEVERAAQEPFPAMTACC